MVPVDGFVLAHLCHHVHGLSPSVYDLAVVQAAVTAGWRAPPVHLIRNSMSFASGKDRKPIAQALRSVYRAESPEAGMAALESFEEGPWDRNTRLSPRTGGAAT